MINYDWLLYKKAECLTRQFAEIAGVVCPKFCFFASVYLVRAFVRPATEASRQHVSNHAGHPRKVRLAKEVFTDDLRSLLEQATIECDDAFIVIKRYDCEHAFHFIDPPYVVGSNMGYYSGSLMSKICLNCWIYARI